jgi:hypothetical protein
MPTLKTVILKCIRADHAAQYTGNIYPREVLQTACDELQSQIAAGLVPIEFSQHTAVYTEMTKVIGIVRSLSLTKTGHYRLQFEYLRTMNADLIKQAKSAMAKKLAHITPFGRFTADRDTNPVTVTSLTIFKFKMCISNEETSVSWDGL